MMASFVLSTISLLVSEQIQYLLKFTVYYNETCSVCRFTIYLLFINQTNSKLVSFHKSKIWFKDIIIEFVEFAIHYKAGIQ